MMTKILFPANLTKDEGGRFSVFFPDLPEAITEGETLDEALYNATEVLTLTLEARAEEGLEIPEPSQKLKGMYLIAPTARVQAALLLRLARGDHSIADLARALDTSWPAIQRLEDPKHWSNLRNLERAASALGKQLVLQFI